MSVIKEGYLYIEKKNMLTKTWKKRWFILFRKNTTESLCHDEYLFYYINDSYNLDDYVVTFIEIKTLTEMNYKIKNDRKVLELQYCHKNGGNYYYIRLAADNVFILSEWFNELSKARDFMRENISLDNEFISKIQSSPFYVSVNPRYNNKPNIYDSLLISSDPSLNIPSFDQNCIFYIGTLQFPPSNAPFKHGAEVAFTIQGDTIIFKPAILTLGEIRPTTITIPLITCSRFGITNDAFFIEVDDSNLSSFPSCVFSLKADQPNKLLKEVIKYCKNYQKQKKNKTNTNFIGNFKAKSSDSKSNLEKSKNDHYRSFFHNNSIYNTSDDLEHLGKSFLKRSKKFLTLRRTKNS